MDTAGRQKLLVRYASALAYVAVRDQADNRSIGTAFHVGDGVFVTARHVVENVTIEEVKATEFLRIDINDEFPDYPQEMIDEITNDAGSPPTGPILPENLNVVDGPYYHENENADVAVFRVEHVHPKLPFVPLGSHLDDWIVGAEWRLSEALILGYPPIPFTNAPELVAARAEVNAVVWSRAQSHATFLLSAMPRGGFSGGLALHEFDFALGVITQSLVKDEQPAELGFLSVLSVEPIYECLAQNKMLPKCQREGWDDFWNTDSADFVKEGGLMVASVHVYDDGTRFYFDVNAHEQAVFEHGVKAGLAALGDATFTEEKVRDGWSRFHLNARPAEASGLVRAAGVAAQDAIGRTGLRQVRGFVGAG